MKNNRILVFTEMDFRGSGYYYLMSPILNGLAKLGWDIKVVGLSYAGQEHTYDFSIIQCQSISDGVAIIRNLEKLWKPALLICGLDIPLQLNIHENLKSTGVELPFIAVTPLENPPLTQSWAAGLMAMNWVFFISELGKNAAELAGLKNVGHIRVGVDTESMRIPTPEERKLCREGLGLADDEFVILTVADNQERKNLWAGLEIVSRLKKRGNKVRHVLVTRSQSQVGHNLTDLAIRLDINKELMVIERGIPKEELWKLYAASDIYLSCSKAEGYGLPITDAMACGLLVVASDTGAITELLGEGGRGFPLPAEYTFTDVWGNSTRKMVDIDFAVNLIEKLIPSPTQTQMFLPAVIQQAREYVESRTYDIPVSQMDRKLKEILDEN